MAESSFAELTSAIAGGVEAFCTQVWALTPEQFDVRTRCPGWRVRDLVWHCVWGEGPGEVIRAAREGAGPVPYATERMTAMPSDDEIVAASRDRPRIVRGDMEALTDDDAAMIVRYGRDDPGRTLSDYLWANMCEVAVHGDDLRTALGIDEPVDPAIAAELVRRRVRGAVAYASRDLLQPVAPRAYRLTSDDLDTGFLFRDGSWREGVDDSIPTWTFTGDNTTLLRLVMGRIPVTSFQASSLRPWDERLGLGGDFRAASPVDFMRWCYGAW